MSLISKFGEVEFSHWCFHILPKVMSERGLRQFSSPFHLGISLYSWDNLPDFCGGGGRLYVCRFICMSSNIHVEVRVNLRLYSSGTMHLAFETGSLCGRRGLQTRWGLQTRRGWLGRGPQRPTCLHLPSTEGAPTSGLFCIGPYFV